MPEINIGPVLRPPQLIIVAMALGVLALGAVCVGLVSTGNMRTDAQLASVLLPVLVLVTAGMIPVHLMVRRGIVSSAQRAWSEKSGDDSAVVALAARFVVLTFVGGAQAEGVSLFGGVVYLITGVAWVLLVPAIGLLVLAALFPTKDRFRRFAAAVTGDSWDDSIMQ